MSEPRVLTVTELLGAMRNGVEEATGGFVSLDNGGRTICAECGCHLVFDEAKDILCCPLCGHAPDEQAA